MFGGRTICEIRCMRLVRVAGAASTVRVRVRVRVRYGYGTGTVRVRVRVRSYPCTVPMYRTDRTRTRTQIAAEIAADLLLFQPLFGYVYGCGQYGTWVRYAGTTTVPVPVPVPCPYRTRTVPVPVPAPVPVPYSLHPRPYPHQKPVPTVPYLSKPLTKTPSAPHVINPIENMVFIALEIS